MEMIKDHSREHKPYPNIMTVYAMVQDEEAAATSHVMRMMLLHGYRPNKNDSIICKTQIQVKHNDDTVLRHPACGLSVLKLQPAIFPLSKHIICLHDLPVETM